MIKKMAGGLTDKLIKVSAINHDDQEVCSYGLEIAISSILSIVAVIILGIFYGKLIHSIFFLIAYCTLRAQAGGFHASCHRNCISLFIFSFIIIISKINILKDSSIIFLTWGICMVILFLYAPVEALNNPLDEKIKKIMRKKSLILCFIFFLFYQLLQLIGLNELSLFVSSGVYLCCTLVLVGQIKNQYILKRKNIIN